VWQPSQGASITIPQAIATTLATTIAQPLMRM
jgi:hypothetical protein